MVGCTQGLGVSIVNYRTPELVVRCLDSLDRERVLVPNLKVVVVDNLSEDGSYQSISQHVVEKGYSDWIDVIAAEKNGGFSYGNNIAFRKLTGCDFIWMLNPDTELHSGAASTLIQFLTSNPTVGVAGSRLEDVDGTPQISAFRFPSPLGELVSTAKLGPLSKLLPRRVIPMGIFNQPFKADWLAGASMMMKAEVLASVGEMDEQYFLYFEEVDFCMKIASQGYEIWCVPESRIIHQVGASTGISDLRKKSKRRPTYWFDSRRYFFVKNFGTGKAIIADILWMLGYASWLLRSKVQGKENLDPPYFLSDFWKNSSCKQWLGKAFK